MGFYFRAHTKLGGNRKPRDGARNASVLPRGESAQKAQEKESDQEKGKEEEKEVIEAMEKQMHEILGKHVKTAARKQHYYSIAMLVGASMQGLVDANKAKELLAEKLEEDPDSVPNEMSKAVAIEMLARVTPLYLIASSLENYRKAFGELPEWTKFLPATGRRFKERGIDDWIKVVSKTFKVCNELLGKNPQGEWLKDLALGPRFIKACEEVKLKGEE